MRYFILATLFTVSACTGVASPPSTSPTNYDPEAATGFTQKTGVHAHKYMVSAATPAAAQAGADILARGGSAADAAVAVQAMLTLTEPQSSGIGGGGFILYWDAAKQQLYTIDARETAPQAATADLFLDEVGNPPASFMNAVTGGRSVGTPGALRGLELVQQRWGRLPWSMLFESTIAKAEEGFVVSPRLQQLLEIEMSPGLLQLSPAKEYFYPNGIPLQAGTVKKNPELAQTLKAIAQGGADAFYHGELAEAIAQSVQQSALNPGRLQASDLAQYQAIIREPVCIEYRVYNICGMPPPSSGGLTILQMLGILEHFPMAELEINSAQAIHYFTQASRLAFADRNRYIGDPAFTDVPVTEMLDKAYLASRAALITDQDMGTAMPGKFVAYAYADDQALELPSTTHFSIVDSTGNILAMTSSIEMGFGSAVMVGGFLLNNQLTDFSLVPEVDGVPVANRVEPGKRPRSSMAPVIVFNEQGEPIHALGSPGGARIINYVAQTLIGLLDWELDMQAAIDLPHVTNLNGATALEQGTTIEDLADALKQRGHTVNIQDLNSGLHGISLLPDGKLFGGADPRREGHVVGDQNH